MRRSHFPAQDPRLTVVVGWNNPLATFCAQVCDPCIEDEDEACVLWLGTAPQAISTVAALQAQLAGWATIPAALVARLTREQQAATPPTSLQRWARQILESA